LGQSKHPEYALGTYSGLTFIQVSPTHDVLAAGKTFHVQKSQEVYLKGQSISSYVEYAPNLFAVCPAKDEYIYLIDR